MTQNELPSKPMTPERAVYLRDQVKPKLDAGTFGIQDMKALEELHLEIFNIIDAYAELDRQVKTWMV